MPGRLSIYGPLLLAVLSSRGRLDILWALLAGAGIFLLMPLLKSSPALDSVGVLFALGTALLSSALPYMNRKAVPVPDVTT